MPKDRYCRYITSQMAHLQLAMREQLIRLQSAVNRFGRTNNKYPRARQRTVRQNRRKFHQNRQNYLPIRTPSGYLLCKRLRIDRQCQRQHDYSPKSDDTYQEAPLEGSQQVQLEKIVTDSELYQQMTQYSSLSEIWKDMEKQNVASHYSPRSLLTPEINEAKLGKATRATETRHTQKVGIMSPHVPSSLSLPNPCSGLIGARQTLLTLPNINKPLVNKAETESRDELTNSQNRAEKSLMTRKYINNKLLLISKTGSRKKRLRRALLGRGACVAMDIPPSARFQENDLSTLLSLPKLKDLNKWYNKPDYSGLLSSSESCIQLSTDTEEKEDQLYEMNAENSRFEVNLEEIDKSRSIGLPVPEVKISKPFEDNDMIRDAKNLQCHASQNEHQALEEICDTASSPCSTTTDSPKTHESRALCLIRERSQLAGNLCRGKTFSQTINSRNQAHKMDNFIVGNIERPSAKTSDPTKCKATVKSKNGKETSVGNTEIVRCSLPQVSNELNHQGDMRFSKYRKLDRPVIADARMTLLRKKSKYSEIKQPDYAKNQRIRENYTIFAGKIPLKTDEHDRSKESSPSLFRECSSLFHDEKPASCSNKKLDPGEELKMSHKQVRDLVRQYNRRRTEGLITLKEWQELSKKSCDGQNWKNAMHQEITKGADLTMKTSTNESYLQDLTVSMQIRKRKFRLVNIKQPVQFPQPIEMQQTSKETIKNQPLRIKIKKNFSRLEQHTGLAHTPPLNKAIKNACPLAPSSSPVHI